MNQSKKQKDAPARRGPRAPRRGAAHPRAVLTTADVDKIRELFSIGIPTSELASRFEVSPQHIRAIVRCRARILG